MKAGKIFAAAVCAGSVFLCACSRQQEQRLEEVQIGVACYDLGDTFISALVDCFQKQMTDTAEAEQDIAATVTVMDAAGVQRTQNDQIKEMMDSGCSVICVNLVDRTDPSEIIDLARENGVPLIFFNREPVAEDMLQWNSLYYVGADAQQSGIMQGELAADAIRKNPQIDRNKDGKIQYVVLEGEPGHQDAIIRTENAVDTLKKNGIALEKLSYGIANWNRAQAQNRMMQMIGQHQNKIELVLANNDDMVLGAIDAYQRLNLSEASLPVFFGIDGTDVGLEAVCSGAVSGTVYNDKEGQAAAMAQLSAALITGEGMDALPFEKDRYIYTDYEKVTAENADEFLEQGR